MKILYIIIGIIGVILLVAALLPKTIKISVETTINAPQATVREYVKHIKNQEYYSVRVMADPNIKLDYSGTDGTVGFTSVWDSKEKNVGAGSQTITSIDEGNSYTVQIDFLRPMKATNFATTTLTNISGTETKVSTLFEGKTARPFNLLSLCFSPMVRKDMEKILSNLKTILEKK